MESISLLASLPSAGKEALGGEQEAPHQKFKDKHLPVGLMLWDLVGSLAQGRSPLCPQSFVDLSALL